MNVIRLAGLATVTFAYHRVIELSIDRGVGAGLRTRPMRQRVGLVIVLAFIGALVGFGRVQAGEGEGEEHHEAAAPAEEHHEAAAPADEHHEAAPAEEHHEAAAAEHHEAAPAEEHEGGEHHEAAAEHEGGEHHEAAAEHQAEGQAPAAAAADDDDDADDDGAQVPYNKFDLDGDGKADPDLEKEYDAAMEGISAKIDSDEVDKELEERPADADMKPSITVEQFRKVVRIVRKVVLAKMEKKMAKGAAKKMREFSIGVSLFSLLGLLLLFMPVALRKRYPGQGKVLFKYSALAAATFVITVNLFGGVLMGMKTVQGALGAATNPSLAIASGTFDTLDDDAEEYITMGKELFVPTLEQLQGNSDEQPSVLLLENGQKIIKDAKVFVSVAKMFKKLDFVFKILPIILFGVTMILFGLAIKPTLIEIIKLPMRAASGEGGVGREVTKRAMRRVWGELLATICTVGVLAALTVLSAFVLGEIVAPALHALLGYFSLAVDYLQFVEGASSGLVFLTLFGVILFLVLNLATLILSMSFFLGKSQKIFQQKFNEHVPIGRHKRFFGWGVPSVLLVQILPWIYALIASKALTAINESMLNGVTDAAQVSWTKLMLAGPAFLVGGFVVMFWAARGLKAIKFLQSYKVVQKTPPPAAPSHEVGESV